MKKILSALIVIIMLIPVLISCGKRNDPSDTAAPDDSDLTGETAPVSEFEPADVDYGGHEIRIYGYGPDEGTSWKGLTCNEIASHEMTGDTINDAVYMRTREIEELYNVKITPILISGSDRNTIASKLQPLILAGEDAFDYAMVNGNCLPAMMNLVSGLVELTSIGGLDLSKSWWDKSAFENFSVGKKLYAATGDISLYNYLAAQGKYFNKKLIDDYQLENPYDIVRRGEWTWGKLHEMSRAVVSDLNGDNVIDGWDRIGMIAEFQALRDGVISAGIKLVSKDADDLPVLTMMHDRSVTVVGKIFDVLADKSCNFLYGFTKGLEDWDRVMAKYLNNEALFFNSQLDSALEFRVMESDFGILPNPKADETQDKYYSIVTMSYTDFVCIPVTCTDVERTVNIIQALGYYGRQYVRPAFYDVTVTHKAVRDGDSLDMLDVILNNIMYDIGYAFNFDGVNDIFNGIMLKGNNTFVSTYESYAPKINAAIDKMVESFGIK